MTMRNTWLRSFKLSDDVNENHDERGWGKWKKLQCHFENDCKRKSAWWRKSTTVCFKDKDFLSRFVLTAPSIGPPQTG